MLTLNSARQKALNDSVQCGCCVQYSIPFFFSFFRAGVCGQTYAEWEKVKKTERKNRRAASARVCV